MCITRKFRLSLLALTATVGLTLAAAPSTTTQAAELQMLQGTPSAQELEDALAPKAAPSGIKFRGITLGGQKPAQPSTATQASAPAPAQAASPGASKSTQQAAAAVAINITFDFNSDRLTPQGQQVLDNLGRALNSERLKASRFMLEGHTDSKGSAAYNQALSERRAKSAKDYLVAKHQIDARRLDAVGKGMSEPLDPADPTRDINRRVQILNLGS